MDEDIETLMIGVRADTAAFAGDAATMQSALQGSLGVGADRAGTLIETSLARAIRSGSISAPARSCRCPGRTAFGASPNGPSRAWF